MKIFDWSFPEWLSLLKMALGFLLLLILGILAAILAIGKVEASTSFGLEQVLGGLLVLAGGFAHWAYGNSKDNR